MVWKARTILRWAWGWVTSRSQHLLYIGLAVGIFMVPGALLSGSWLTPAGSPEDYQEPVLVIALEVDAGEPSSAAVTLYHQVQLSYDGEEWEQLWAYVESPSGARTPDVAVYLAAGDWADNRWSCYTISASDQDGETSFDTLGSNAAHVTPTALDAPQYPVSEFVLRPGAARILGTAPGMSQAFLLAADANTVGVGCERVGILSPSVGGGRRLFQPTTLIVKNSSGEDIVANLSELVSFPGEWQPGSYWATSEGDSTVEWDPKALDGTLEIAEETDALGIAWNDGWYSDIRLVEEGERLAWLGALLIGAGLGAILALLVPPARIPKPPTRGETAISPPNGTLP